MQVKAKISFHVEHPDGSGTVHFARGQVYDIPDDSVLLTHWYVKACTERPPQPKSVSVTPPATGKPKG